MLDHQKTVLAQVIENDEIFVKELRKSVCWLEQNELRNLYIWLQEKYRTSHAGIINSIIKGI